MNYKKANTLSEILCLAGMILLIGIKETVFSIIYLILILTGILIKVIYYRCPQCNKSLPFRTLSTPDYCPYCGEKLDNNK